MTTKYMFYVKVGTAVTGYNSLAMAAEAVAKAVAAGLEVDTWVDTYELMAA